VIIKVVSVEENKELGTYVVKGIEGEPSIEKKYFEGDKPYEVIEKMGELFLLEDANIQKLNEITREIKWFPEGIKAEAYFYVLDYLSYVEVKEEDGMIIVAKKRDIRSVEQSEQKKIIKKLYHWFKGAEKRLKEVANDCKNRAKEIDEEAAEAEVHERMKRIIERIRNLANRTSHLMEEYERTGDRSIAKMIKFNRSLIKKNRKILEFIRGLSASQKQVMVKELFLSVADISDSVRDCLSFYVKEFSWLISRMEEGIYLNPEQWERYIETVFNIPEKISELLEESKETLSRKEIEDIKKEIEEILQSTREGTEEVREEIEVR